ncbi:MAG TPA: FGGY family carbohydrate kinase [Chthoniobacterales bacterium]
MIVLPNALGLIHNYDTRMNPPDLLLAIDVGTGSVRAALVNATGRTEAFAAREHEQIVPRFGWSEQRPADWWHGAVESIRRVLAEVQDAPGRLAGVAACGQMHGTVLIDADGNLTLNEVSLWNDKRTRSLVDRFTQAYGAEAFLSLTANPPTVAWPAFKLQWIREHQAEAYARASTVFMPKDYINFRLTGERAIDLSEASCTYLLDVGASCWSPELAGVFGLEMGKLPPLRRPADVLGQVSKPAAAETGLREGTPVMVGAGDYPLTLLGSGVIEPGMGSDVTGTSTLITVMANEPVLDPVITNVQGVTGSWAAFTILDAGGDAMRWARRAFHENQYPYTQIVELAASAPAGAEALLFLPYLNGERLGNNVNARGQFVGLTGRHGLAHLHRAVMEGVAFASARNVQIMKRRGATLDRLVAAGGGAKTRLWLEIKASIYQCPILTTVDAECGVLGCAILAAVGAGLQPDVPSAVSHFVKYAEEIPPNEVWMERYAPMQGLFDDLCIAGAPFWQRFDRLSPETQAN